MAFRVACQLTSRLTSISPCVGWVWALFHVLKLQGILQGRSIVPKVFNLTTFAFSLCKKYAPCVQCTMYIYYTFIRTGGLGSFKLILQIYTGSHNIFISNLGEIKLECKLTKNSVIFHFWFCYLSALAISSYPLPSIQLQEMVAACCRFHNLDSP